MDRKIAIFASGTGSNFEALANHIINNRDDARVVCLVCDKKNAPVIDKAKKLNIDTLVISIKDYEDKEAYESEILKYLEYKNIDLILLAGYLKIIGDTLLNKYVNRIINIHPSLLPKYPGLNAMKRSYDDKSEMGVTVHYVDSGLDTGKIIKQKKLEVDRNLKFDVVENKMHELEHRLYIEVLDMLLEGEHYEDK